MENIVEVLPIEQEVKKYPITDAEIEEMGKKYSGLEIKGVEDKEGLKILHDARMVVRDARIDVGKAHNFIKEKLKELRNIADDRAEDLIKKLKAIETPLETKENEITAEIERIKQEKKQREAEKLQKRIDGLNQFGKEINIESLKSLTDEEYFKLINLYKKEFEAEQARLAELKKIEDDQIAEETRKKAEAEAERLKKEAEDKAFIESEKIRLAKIEADQKAKQAELDEKLAKIEADEKARKDKELADLKKIEDEKLAKIEADRLLDLKQKTEEQLKLWSDDKIIITNFMIDIEAIDGQLLSLKSNKGRQLSENYHNLVMDLSEMIGN